MKTSVYRYYDTDRRLIYVGITGKGMVRQTQHNSHADWWRFVSTQEVEHVESRAAALHRERELIERFRPPFNREHNPDWQRLRADYLAHAETEDGDDPVELATEAAWCRGHDEGAVRGRWALRWEVASQLLAEKALRMVVDGEGGYLSEPGFVSVQLSARDENLRAYDAEREKFGVEALDGIIPGRRVGRVSA